MLETFMSTEMLVRVSVAILIFLGVMIGFWGLRRLIAGRAPTGGGRGRPPRLAIIDAAVLDRRRRLVLVRRDNVEHLIMIGGPSDVVVEHNIVRPAAAAMGKDMAPSRLPGADPIPSRSPEPVQSLRPAER